MAKKYIGKNVYQASQERIEYLFNEFPNVMVAFSGGKDSTVCLEMCFDYAKSHNILNHLSFYHIDYEAQYQMTTDFVSDCFLKRFEGINKYWLCLPVHAQCCCSIDKGYWIPWDKNSERIWVRKMPQNKYVINESNAKFKYNESDYIVQDNFCNWFKNKYGKTAFVIGIRADESLNRFRAVGTGKAMKYKGISWINGNKAYPIYDWTAEDDFIYFGKFGKPYNRLYDLYYQAGLNVEQMRVASPFNDCASNTLKLYRVIDCNTWSKMVGRVNGVNFTGIYGGTTAMGWKSITKPSNMSWKDYCYFLLSTLDEKTRIHYEAKLNTSIKFWRDKGGALGDETIEELPQEAIVGNPNNYSSKKTVRFETYPDDMEISDFKSVPSYKRMCVCIMKNDYYCKYMGFSTTKEENERRKETIKKYENI